MSLPRNLPLYCAMHQQRQKGPYPPASGSRKCQPCKIYPHTSSRFPVSGSFHAAEASTSSQPARTKTPNDALLRPPPFRPKRRNTIGPSTPLHPFSYDGIHAEGELANEIQQQQEQLIREQQTKRAKAQKQEAASKDPEKPWSEAG